MKFKSNLEITKTQVTGTHINNNEGYIRADELYYFNKNKIKYKVIAHMENELLDQLKELIIYLDTKNKVKNVISNL